MLSANAFNLNQSKILSYDEGLTIKKQSHRYIPTAFADINLDLKPLPKQALAFTRLKYKPLKPLWEREKLLKMSKFLLSPSVLPFWRFFCLYHQIQKCHLQTLCVWKSLKFVVWERVNETPSPKFVHEKAENIPEKVENVFQNCLPFFKVSG